MKKWDGLNTQNQFSHIQKICANFKKILDFAHEYPNTYCDYDAYSLFFLHIIVWGMTISFLKLVVHPHLSPFSPLENEPNRREKGWFNLICHKRTTFWVYCGFDGKESKILVWLTHLFVNKYFFRNIMAFFYHNPNCLKLPSQVQWSPFCVTIC